ncbi:MAG: serine/threonine protein kinase [Polyangiaceae bacterium]|nr:serine/threonine protein kinase [Polyangiaceae bacterium]
MTSPSPDSHKLDRLGDYTVMRVIGEGGMGIVYEAVERLTGRRVALKVLHSNLARSEDARQRFFNEMRIMAGLEHPNIVRSLASREIEGKLVMVLEYLEGKTLRDVITSTGPMAPERAVSIACSILWALAAAHERPTPIVHRDLKPENVMIKDDGSVRVMDFGIAKVLAEDAHVTRASQTVGTVLYMSPEQAESRPVTPKTDLYAVGLLLYEMLDGKALFDGPSIVGILRDHCETPPPPLRGEIRQAIGPDLERLLLELLEKSPESRPADARTVLARLAVSAPRSKNATDASGPLPYAAAAHAPSHPTPERAPKLGTMDLIGKLDDKPRRWPWIVGAAAVLAVGAAIAIPWTLYLQSRAETTKSKTKDSSEESKADKASGPSSAPSSSAQSGCDGVACAPFQPVDPSKVDFEIMFAEATKLARSVDAKAQLWSISFLAMSAAPTIDLTQPKAVSFFHFETAEGDLSVAVRAKQLIAERTAIRSRPSLPPINCTFQRAFEAAIAGGFKQTELYQAGLHVNPVTKAGQWNFQTDDVGSALVDVTTCTLFRGPRRK